MIDVVEFAETVCDIKLLDYQKAFLRTVYNYRKTNKSLPTIGRGNSSMGLLSAEIVCAFYDKFITESEK